MKSFVFALAALSSIATVSAQLGIAYSPFLDDGSTCKTQDQVNDDFTTIFNDDSYGTVRMYGVNCIDVVLSAVNAHGIKLFIGINDLSNVSGDTTTLVNAVNGDWGAIDTVAVGNEGLADGTYSESDIRSAVQQVKSQVSGAGFGGPVTTVDIFYVFINNPGYCDIGDYVAVNCHPFFDTPNGQDYTNAGSFVQTQLANVQSACPNSRVVVTESGWPSAGDNNVNSVPSPSNQAAVIAQLKADFSSGLYLFEAFNDYWKNPGQFNVEQHWGFLGDSSSDPPPSKRSTRARRSPKL